MSIILGRSFGKEPAGLGPVGDNRERGGVGTLRNYEYVGVAHPIITGGGDSILFGAEELFSPRSSSRHQTAHERSIAGTAMTMGDRGTVENGVDVRTEPKRRAWVVQVALFLLDQWLIIGFGISCLLAYYFPGRECLFSDKQQDTGRTIAADSWTPRCGSAGRHHPVRV